MCGSNQLFGSCFSSWDFDVSAVNGAGEGIGEGTSDDEWLREPGVQERRFRGDLLAH